MISDKETTAKIERAFALRYALICWGDMAHGSEEWVRLDMFHFKSGRPIHYLIEKGYLEKHHADPFLVRVKR